MFGLGFFGLILLCCCFAGLGVCCEMCIEQFKIPNTSENSNNLAHNISRNNLNIENRRTQETIIRTENEVNKENNSRSNYPKYHDIFKPE